MVLHLQMKSLWKELRSTGVEIQVVLHLGAEISLSLEGSTRVEIQVVLHRQSSFYLLT